MVASAGGAVSGRHGHPRRRVVSAVVLFGPRAGAPVSPEHANFRPLALALCETEFAGRGVFRWSWLLGLYWLIWTTGGWWWLAAAAAFFVVTIVLGQLAPVVILPLFYKIEKLDAPELADRIARLAAGTGLSIEGVYRMDLSAETVKANAMLAGPGPHPPRAAGRYATQRLSARGDRGHLCPRNRAPRLPPHPQDDCRRRDLQRGRILDLRSAAGALDGPRAARWTTPICPSTRCRCCC